MIVRLQLDGDISDWHDNQKNPNSNFQKLPKERIEKTNPRRTLTAEELKRLELLSGSELDSYASIF